MSLAVSNLDFSYDGDKPVLQDVTVEAISPGRLTALIGPNASGKSTLFRCIAGILKVPPGRISLGGRGQESFSNREWTGKVCYMPQSFACNAALSVFEVVLLARKHLRGWRVSDEDVQAVAELLAQIGIEHLAETFVGDLSGGQQQMVSIAQALVRRPALMLLDEPTSALDLRHQLEVMEIVRRVTIERGIITVVALHDLNLAARYADHAMLMREGRIVSSGDPESILASQELGAAYGVSVELHQTAGGALVVAASL